MNYEPEQKIRPILADDLLIKHRDLTKLRLQEAISSEIEYINHKLTQLITDNTRLKGIREIELNSKDGDNAPFVTQAYKSAGYIVEWTYRNGRYYLKFTFDLDALP